MAGGDADDGPNHGARPAVLDEGGDIVRLPSILGHLPVGVARGLGDRQRCAAFREVQGERHILGGLDAGEPTGVVGVEHDADAVAQTRGHHQRLAQGRRQRGVVDTRGAPRSYGLGDHRQLHQQHLVVQQLDDRCGLRAVADIERTGEPLPDRYQRRTG